MTEKDESLRTILAHSGTAPDYTMGAFQQEAGILPETLRSWESRYGFPVPSRTAGNHRVYSERDLVAVRWLIQQTGNGKSISTAVATLKRSLPDDSPQWKKSIDAPPSPMNRLVIALHKENLAQAQHEWDALVLGLSPDAMCQVISQLDATIPRAGNRARAFLLRKATVLLDAASPDVGSTPVMIVTTDDPVTTIPATLVATQLARRGYQVITPCTELASLAAIDTMRQAGARHAVLIDIDESWIDSLRALIPEISLHIWSAHTGIPDTLPYPDPIASHPSTRHTQHNDSPGGTCRGNP